MLLTDGSNLQQQHLVGSEMYAAINKESTFTVDEAIEHIGFGKFQLKLSLMFGIAWMSYSMEITLLSVLSPQLRCQWQLYAWQEALISTIPFIGVMSSAIFWGYISDKYGRKSVVYICSVWVVYMSVLSAFSPNFYWVLILRGLAGIGEGGVVQAVTMFTEALPRKSRGSCIMLMAAFWGLGATFEITLALFVMPTLGWRYLLVFSALPMFCTILVTAAWGMPESARFDIQVGHVDEAYATLKRIAKENDVAMPTGRLVSATPITHQHGNFRNLFKTKNMSLTTVLLCLIWFNCTFAYYGVILLSSQWLQNHRKGTCFGALNHTYCMLTCHELNKADYLTLLWTTLSEFPGFLLALFLINTIGRRGALATTFLCFATFILLLEMCTSRRLMTVFVFIARASIAGGFQSSSVYTAEVYPTNIRSIGMGVASAFSEFGSIITPFIAQMLMKRSQSLTVLIYGCVSISAGVLAFFLPIETKGRALEEIEEPDDGEHKE